MGKINQFEDLPVWQAARKLSQDIYTLTKKAPFNKDLGLRSQIQRAAVSVGSNIAEGFERGSKDEFIHFLYIARGSAGEVRSQLYNAFDIDYISEKDMQYGVDSCLKISRQIASFVNYLKGSGYKGDKYRKTTTKKLS